MENLEQKEPQPEPGTGEPMPSPVSQPPTSENKPSMVLPIVLSLVMFILGGVSVFAYFTFWKPEKVVPQPIASPSPISSPLPSPDLTADWKVYTNTKYRYSIKIPPTWGNYSMSDFSFSGTIGNEEQYLYLGPKESTRKPPQSVEIEVEGKVTIEQRLKEGRGMGPKECTEEKVEVGRDRVLATRSFCQEWQRGPSFKIEKDNYVYFIDNTMENSADWSIFDLMLQTFKFTE